MDIFVWRDASSDGKNSTEQSAAPVFNYHVQLCPPQGDTIVYKRHGMRQGSLPWLTLSAIISQSISKSGRTNSRYASRPRTLMVVVINDGVESGTRLSPEPASYW